MKQSLWLLMIFIGTPSAMAVNNVDGPLMPDMAFQSFSNPRVHVAALAQSYEPIAQRPVFRMAFKGTRIVRDVQGVIVSQYRISPPLRRY